MQAHSPLTVAVIGPESTGKSTLTKLLTNHYRNSALVEEYARTFLNQFGTNYTFDDLLQIAKAQVKAEDEAIQNTENKIIFLDTNLYVIKVWAEYVFGKCHQWILDQIVIRQYSFYLLLNIDIPWVADNMREYPDELARKELFAIYSDILHNQTTPWAIINGNYDQRYKQSILQIDKQIQIS